jgi:hypothetical protein
MICPVCGNSKKQQGFCTNCGTELETAAAGIVEKKEGSGLFFFGWSEIVRTVRFHTLWLVVAVFFVAMGTGWFRYFLYAEERAVHQVISAIDAGNLVLLADQLVAADGSKYPINELQAFVGSIQAAGVQEHLAYESIRLGKKYAILPKYGVMVQPIQPVVRTNLVGAKWFVNGKAVTVESTDELERWKLPPLLPQAMELVGLKETAYGPISTRAIWQPHQWEGESQPTLEALFEYRKVHFQTDTRGVQLYVNGFPVQEIPYPNGLEMAVMPSQVEIELKKTFPWGELVYWTGERSLEDEGVYRLPIKEHMKQQLYPALKQKLVAHIDSYAIGAQDLDLTKVQGMSEQGIGVLEQEWAPYMEGKYFFTGTLTQLDMYPKQITLVGGDRAQLIATVHFKDYQWTNEEGKHFYEAAPGAKTYAYELIFLDGEWKVHSYKPLTSFVYDKKESILMEEENAPFL